MAHTDHQTMRRVLRREIAGTVGVLTDDHDFRAMRRYRSFTFDDHAAYLRNLETVLKARAAQGTHTTLALFDPEDYAAYCADTGLDPDAPASRGRFTAELAATGPTVPYDGRPLADLLPALVDEAVRQATWEYATTLLTRLGPCPTCGQDIGRASFTRASALLVRILDTAPRGDHHLVCTVAGPPETLVSVLHTDQDPHGETRLDEAEALEFTSVLALGLATRSPGGLVMRTTATGTADRVYGWRLRAGALEPLTASEVFDAYCTDVESGDPIPPESGVDYGEPPALGEESTARDHHH
ncbi:hypothetical protein GCM10018980_74860 [Streptomyces capoamus]|uniref:Uncharacterized protein n=1 Tax=Streptomyces capoamus TaxID=68183 RepID=A0A919KG55_9ACTN|nr:hypothetical protein [Streptomyces capoamus]GGW19679.1 hypothetical protein GCM10010501_58350 [Streptomyces libani subsp. rufus]GHG76810.1 hypothetical protein GCM10018980_74860 [Streptomyces capoamus]